VVSLDAIFETTKYPEAFPMKAFNELNLLSMKSSTVHVKLSAEPNKCNVAAKDFIGRYTPSFFP
jgi:hypothetical protein